MLLRKSECKIGSILISIPAPLSLLKFLEFNSFHTKRKYQKDHSVGGAGAGGGKCSLKVR